MSHQTLNIWSAAKRLAESELDCSDADNARAFFEKLDLQPWFGNEFSVSINTNTGRLSFRVFNCYEGFPEVIFHVERNGQVTVERRQDHCDISEFRRISF